MAAEISVVVPFYNNAGLLADCLASIAAQTFADLEVIMVDDGSTDGSADIARERAAADQRFTLISQSNAGPGAARNRGVERATGEFLAFVDADDTLPPEAYQTMIAVLRQTGSDLVTGAVRRLEGGVLTESGLHSQAIKNRRLGTHISKTPELFYDISVWNKLFRRSFWDAAAMTIPEGMLWEDLVSMTRAHVLARAVDVIADPIYIWRDRDRDAPSITQSRTDISNFRDRITALEMIDAFLRERATPAMLRAHQRKALVNDIWLYVRDLAVTDPAYVGQFVVAAQRYLRTVDRRVLAEQPSTRKLAYHLIAAGRERELTRYAAWLATWPGRTPPMARTWRGLVADLPTRGDRELGVPPRVFRPRWRELDPYVGIDKIYWENGRLVVTGSAYVPSVDVGERRRTTKLVVLVHRNGARPPIVLPARSVRRPELTSESGQDRYSYDWAGFRCEIGPGVFRAGGRWLAGDWDCFIVVRGGGVWRPARLHGPGPEVREVAAEPIAPGLTLAPVWTGRRLRLAIRSGSGSGPADPAGPGDADLVITAARWHEGELVLSGTVAADQPEGAYAAVLRQRGGSGRHVVPVTRDGAEFVAVLPVARMPEFGERRPLRDGLWEIGLMPGGRLGDRFLPPAARLTAAGKRFECVAGLATDAPLAIEAGPVLRLAERGRIRRALLREVYYRLQRLLPLRDQVLLRSFDGKQCGDNPGGIAAELRRRADRRPRIWVVADRSVPAPPGERAVLSATMAYYAALGRSRYLIANDHQPQPFRKRPGQRYVQTWHGAPFKRIGYDIGVPRFASGQRYFSFMADDVARWDVLLSPDPFATPILRRAFGYQGEICESGYPRDDELLTGARDLARAVRERLGIPDGPKVAMYVPTWRDDQHDGGGYRLDFRLDLPAAASALAGEYVLLIRGHHLMASGLPDEVPAGFAIDVTGYPDIADLLAATDVLITDYSSVIFDFAPTGRPILFFTYDLDRYRDQLRGFYFDFSSVVPGPLLATSDEVIEALAAIDAVAAENAQRAAAFTTRFCSLSDGKAGVRACDRIFGAEVPRGTDDR